jgi:hypothetical protein
MLRSVRYLMLFLVPTVLYAQTQITGPTILQGGPPGPQGTPGTPGTPGVGVPLNGTTGQVLTIGGTGSNPTLTGNTLLPMANTQKLPALMNDLCSSIVLNGYGMIYNGANWACGPLASFFTLAGDVTGLGTANTVVKVNGGSIPTSKAIVGTNSSGQFVDASSTVLTNNISGNAATATTATHASNLPADFATQSLASPANGSFNTISAGNTIAAGTSTPTTIGATGVTFPDGTVQSTKAVSLSTAYWQRQGTLFTPTSADENSAQEATVFYESGPTLLPVPAPLLGSNPQGNVFKMVFSCAWLAGNICYAESYSGMPGTWVRAASPIIAGTHARTFWFKNAGTYYLYSLHINGSGGGIGIDQYTASASAGPYTLAHSNVITNTQAWETANGGANCYVWIEGSTWYMANEWQTTDTAVASHPYVIGIATSTDGFTWTKYSGNPVLGDIAAYPTVGGPEVHKVGSTYYLWAQASVPTSSPLYYAGFYGLPNGIMRFHSTDLHTWVSDGFSLSCKTDDEGAGINICQVADPSLLEVNGQTYMFYEGTSNAFYSTGNIHLKVAVVPYTIAQLTALTETDGAVLSPAITTTTTSNTGYVTPPVAPTSAGSAGQWAAASGYFYAYDSVNSKWGQVAISESWTGAYQAFDNFGGVTGTLLTAHPDALGHSWAVYTIEGLPGMTSDSLTGSGSAYLPTGGPTTAYGDMLNSLTPSSANYTVSLTCTPVTTTGSVAVFARASSGANTNYAFTVGAGASATGALYRTVAGTATQIGSFYTGGALRPWNVGTPHTFALLVNGTTITASIDGTIVINVTDSGIATTGQTGMRIVGGNTVTCTNFTVQ